MQFKLDITHSLETETKQVYHSAGYVFKNFYFPNGWYVVGDNLEVDPLDPVIILPKLDYLQLKFNHLDKDRFDFNSFSQEDTQTLELIKKSLKDKVVLTSKAKLDDYRVQLTSALGQAFAQLEFLLKPLSVESVKVDVSLSWYGSYGSFDQAVVEDGRLIIGVQPRLDQPLTSTTLELVVSSLIYLVTQQDKLTWQDRESISDFLFRHVLKKTDFLTTLERVNKNRPDLLKRSLEFLHSVGLPAILPLEFDEKLNRILVMGRDVSLEFGPYEFRVLKGLVLNAGRVLTYDQLTDFMYQVYPDARFSLWSITKVIQRLRDKLEKLGFPRKTIQTVRGEGFRLVMHD